MKHEDWITAGDGGASQFPVSVEAAQAQPEV